MVTFNSSMDSQSSPPPFSDSPSSAGVPIAAVIAVGFFATSVVLSIYYVLVVRFWLHGRQRPQSGYIPPIFFSYDTEGGRGVDPSLIKSIPVVIFKKGKDGEKMKNLSSHECAVCLADFQEKESIKVLPGCSHAFHIDCIDTWLQFNVNCPMCRSVVTSSSLAQMQDGRLEGQPEVEVRVDGRHEGDVAPRNENSVGRSFSMDWFSERRIKREGSSSSAVNGDTSGRFMRLVHSFRLGRSSRNAVLPIQMEP